MGQYWNFYNIDKREMGEKNGMMKFCEFFFHKQGFLVRSMTATYRNAELFQGGLFQLRANMPKVAHEKGLLSLPDELLLEIMGPLEGDPFALGALALTCHRLFEIMLGKVEILRDFWAVPWGGDRIVCLGDSSNYDDVPETLFTETERAEIEKKRSQEPDQVDMSYAGVHALGLEEHRLFFFGAHSLYDPTLFTKSVLELLDRFTPSDGARFRTLMGVVYPPGEQDWALFNVSKKQYVRASEIAKLAGRPDDPQPFLPNCRVDLGHALLTRIAWSSDDSISIAENTTTRKLHRGQWAGDRFLIAILKGLPVEDWTDVSEEVVHDLTEIYKAEYGARWKDAIEAKIWEGDKYEWYWMRSDGDDETAVRGRQTKKRPLPGMQFFVFR